MKITRRQFLGTAVVGAAVAAYGGDDGGGVGGFGLHLGIERVGAGIVPAAGGNTPRQYTLTP